METAPMPLFRLLPALLLLPALSTLAQTAEIAARVVDAAGKPVADAVVVAVPSDGALRLPSRPREGVVDQVDKEFTPKVTAILVGTPVTFRTTTTYGIRC